MQKKKAVTAALVISGALTVVICAVMNFCLIPQIEASTQGIRCFDMNATGYTFEQAQKFLSLLSEEGRDVYLHSQLPLDFVYPAAYGVFFVLLIASLCGKFSVVCFFPILLALCDYCENTCTIQMLRAESLSASLASFASFMTVCKSALMYVTFAVIILLIILKIRKKGKTRISGS